MTESDLKAVMVDIAALVTVDVIVLEGTVVDFVVVGMVVVVVMAALVVLVWKHP
ncbi:hypothetical protein C5167_044744 [Papaver somniferum]|nr:hypothetical protein C5167_044744 [Papaver somniferum]